MNRIQHLLILLLVLCGSAASAQWRPAANLTVFSEDGLRFYLVLNGQRYNDIPQTHVRVEGLPSTYYNCKIIFEDSRIQPLSKNRLMTADVDNVLQDVTYRIKRDNKGRNVLRFYSFVPVTQNMPRPAGCAVYSFGKPNVMIGVRGGGRDDRDYNDRPGMNININDDDDDNGRGYRSDNRYNNDRNGNGRGGARCNTAMSRDRFEAARRSVSDSKFEDTRLSMARQLLSGNCMSAVQVAAICGVFNFEESRLDFAKYAYNYCVDPQNYFEVSRAFTFESSKTELNNYIQGSR